MQCCSLAEWLPLLCIGAVCCGNGVKDLLLSNGVSRADDCEDSWLEVNAGPQGKGKFHASIMRTTPRGSVQSSKVGLEVTWMIDTCERGRHLSGTISWQGRVE
ncbi:hypothetical protein V8C44DRAFT_253297 [Trichoderma aethiopicum]